MGLPEIARVGRNIAVLVRVRGPDPKGVKMRKHAFHKYDSGATSLSASGFLLPDALCDSETVKQFFGDSVSSTAFVVTVASVIESFLSPNHQGNISQASPQLIPGVQIDILMEDSEVVEQNAEDSCWIPARLLTLVDVPVSSLALQSLLDNSFGSSGHNWETGWSLASKESAPWSTSDLIRAEHQRLMTIEEWINTTSASMAKSLTKIAFLGISLPLKNLPSITISPSITSGDFILAVGSPFGVLSPKHFLNSICAGSVSNCYPPSASKSLLMADIRCLPGMEGCPILDKNSSLVGILLTPLRQRTSGAQVQLLIPYEAIVTAFSHILRKEPSKKFSNQLNRIGNELSYISEGPLFDSSTIKKAMGSVCLIVVGDSMWASGILLNKEGLILTNAHLLEPWRFGRNSFGDEEIQVESLPPRANSVDENGQFGLDSPSSVANYKKIRVRLDHRDPWIWCDAKLVYICKGSLDVALLQLINVPGELVPITVDITTPLQGSSVCVIGHGLFGPRCEFSPSVSWGLVSKVVKMKLPKFHWSIINDGESRVLPVMLETTTTVYAGASGGLVANSEGHMIGLITSNTRHDNGAVIPNLNFAIPCSALAPILEFSLDMKSVSLLQDLDRPNKLLSSVWELMPLLSREEDPTLPGGLPLTFLEDGKKEGKGSRFAKFLVENDLLNKSRDMNAGGRLPAGALPSKL
ncbi:hypothetical protein SAY87_031317 [Trapa incisa]|uniref:Glyoxysomal processing protease, glyoxysomal n=1 Tax=Trapa incisa TaxID=236973 RepID=A0AAN7KVU4_9MYRT|nr:hypothetical protein SAY87_031317 [Trapa incisa]